jgi:hypothetical protein
LIEISLEFGIEIKKIPADLQETAYLVSWWKYKVVWFWNSGSYYHRLYRQHN